ncbi:MAG: deoxyribonuclease V [Planctomycetaceae bacterium]|nr:deoxyribonuclease V [Planctomycetaceae bacterium]
MSFHRWNISPRQAIALQRRLARRVIAEPLAAPVRTIAGTDCAFLDDGRKIAAVAVLCDARTLSPLASAVEVRACTFPYVPGLLSFREAPAVIAAIEKLPQRPDLLMCDGQGIAHPRGLGLASHVGLLLDLPTIGVAKSRLCGEHRKSGLKRGNRAQLIFDGNKVGVALRTRDGVNPLYISVGHRITLEQAIRWTLRASRFRLPEPTRLAHQTVSRFKKTCPRGADL